MFHTPGEYCEAVGESSCVTRRDGPIDYFRFSRCSAYCQIAQRLRPTCFLIIVAFSNHFYDLVCITPEGVAYAPRCFRRETFTVCCPLFLIRIALQWLAHALRNIHNRLLYVSLTQALADVKRRSYEELKQSEGRHRLDTSMGFRHSDTDTFALIRRPRLYLIAKRR
jgi:hypothetical protein